jgi:hypothetical protein
LDDAARYLQVYSNTETPIAPVTGRDNNRQVIGDGDFTTDERNFASTKQADAALSGKV